MAGTGQQEARADLLTSVIIGAGVVVVGMPIVGLLGAGLWNWLQNDGQTFIAFFIFPLVFLVVILAGKNRIRQDIDRGRQEREGELWASWVEENADEIYQPNGRGSVPLYGAWHMAGQIKNK
jgi:hypothetical protein